MQNKMQVVHAEYFGEAHIKLRMQHICASEAPVIMGDSKFMSRAQLLRLKKSGVQRDVNEWTQKIFDQGHHSEFECRPKMEKICDFDLFPISGRRDLDGVPIFASFDGINFPLNSVHWEHKQFNEDKYNCILGGDISSLPDTWQLEFQMLVNGNNDCFYSCGNDPEKFSHIIYEYNNEKRQKLVEAIKIFWDEVQNPEVEGEFYENNEKKSIESLPSIQISTHAVVSRSNLFDYEQAAINFIESLRSDLETDEDFALGESALRLMKDQREALKTAKHSIIKSSADIEAAVNKIEWLDSQFKNKITFYKSAIDQKKEKIKHCAIMSRKRDFEEYVLNKHKEISGYKVIYFCDLSSAIKNKKTMVSINNALDSALANAKSEYMILFNKVKSNIDIFEEKSKGYGGLFVDKNMIVNENSAEAVSAIVSARIEAAKADESRRNKMGDNLEPTNARQNSRSETVINTENAEQDRIKNKANEFIYAATGYIFMQNVDLGFSEREYLEIRQLFAKIGVNKFYAFTGENNDHI